MAKLPFELYETAARKAAETGNPQLVEEVLSHYVTANSAYSNEPLSTKEREKILKLSDELVKIARKTQIIKLLEKKPQSPLEVLLASAADIQKTRGGNK